MFIIITLWQELQVLSATHVNFGRDPCLFIQDFSDEAQTVLSFCISCDGESFKDICRFLVWPIKITEFFFTCIIEHRMSIGFNHAISFSVDRKILDSASLTFV